LQTQRNQAVSIRRKIYASTYSYRRLASAGSDPAYRRRQDQQSGHPGRRRRKAAVGTQNEAQAREKLADPAVAAQLETRLVEIALEAQKARAQAENDRRQSDFAKLQASLADTPAARSSLTNLADKGSPISWGRRWFPSSSGSAFSW